MNKGYCAFGDADGDRIFTDWDGNAVEGTNHIAGGTGKYRGITGSGPWKCWDTPHNHPTFICQYYNLIFGQTTSEHARRITQLLRIACSENFNSPARPLW
jgi:hypothetical protein